MTATRRRLHRRETLPDSGVDRRRRRLTSLSFTLSSTTSTHRNHGEAGVCGESTLSTDRHLRLSAYNPYYYVISTAFP